MLKKIGMCVSLFFSLMRVSWQMVRGLWRISKLPEPVVSIFGGGKLPKEIHYFEKAQSLSHRFITHDISVLTGGGPGVMEAARYGATLPTRYIEGQGRNINIGVKNLKQDTSNQYAQEYFELDYFFARKWLLTRYSQAFVVFPGGFGTLDELTEVLTLIITKKIKRVPIVLVGVEYWADLMSWMEKQANLHKLIDVEDLKLIVLTDNLDEVFDIVARNCKCS